MTSPLFLLERFADPLPAVGESVQLDGDEGRHAVVVRRLRPGESILLSNGRGLGLRGRVTHIAKASLTMEVTDQLSLPESELRLVAVQALAKGDRSELALEMLTEMGVHEIVPWQASRSIVRWNGDRTEKSLARWRSTVREATKQSRRLRIPEVSEPLSTSRLVERISASDVSLVLHEEATTPLSAVELPAAGEVLVVIGPEGGIGPDELAAFHGAGAQQVVISDAVLRTSTAGVVALAGLLLR
ncbi:MAG: 16S rRNA (uracil(1498)-N(3))-methyltransferase [uncultured Propionibacteriaceae bacterium]|uniref:Ribosomal RNA small subunit methyltransferase E n=1 Tax=uncultured Propionibacteriaceae bacterium TaxID=257457 RepID=A0A6J4NXZ4_9ACTN|nr:MAG: 16S rRNA (uracil(1498)-N(3))-methyltransferase [uncultured Propionibacteriaceae bacterium]